MIFDQDSTESRYLVSPPSRQGNAFLFVKLPNLWDPQFTQDVFHQAPLGEGRLEQIGPDKGGKKVPIGAVKIAQKQGQQDKTSSDSADIALHSHGNPSHSRTLHQVLNKKFPQIVVSTTAWRRGGGYPQRKGGEASAESAHWWRYGP
jgi:hypothetical protein